MSVSRRGGWKRAVEAGDTGAVMRALGVVVLLVAGCGSGPSGGLPDAAVDAACTPSRIFTGGVAADAQGWSVATEGAATLSLDGADTVVTTTTPTGARTGGQLLLYRAGALPTSPPFAVELTVQVDRVDPHNEADAGAAILGGFTAPYGLPAERAQMIYLDANAVGWADNTERFARAITGGPRSITLDVDAAGAATVLLDGAAVLRRAGYAGNGTLAIGDQSNDPGVDATLRIRAITRLCR